jgi:hypothetical protein
MFSVKPILLVKVAEQESIMSDRIEQIIEVVEEVKKEYKDAGRGFSKISDLRLRAVKRVANRREIDHTTVSDKYRRQLKPDVTGTAEFDRLLKDWLDTGSNRLQDVLLRHSVGVGDKRRVKKFFESNRIGSRADGEQVSQNLDPGYADRRGSTWRGSETRNASKRTTAPPERENQEMISSEEAFSQAVETVLRYERKQGRAPDDVSSEEYGFDVRSLQFDDDGTLDRIRYIAVKAVIPSEDIKVSAGEWDQASNFDDKFWLYMVTGLGTDDTRLHRIQNPAAQLHLGEDIIATGYIICKDAWREFVKEK